MMNQHIRQAQSQGPRFRSIGVMSVAAALISLGCAASGGDSGNPEDGRVAQAQAALVLPGQPVVLSVAYSVTVPADLTLSALAISGAQVDIGDRSTVRTPEGQYAAIGGPGPNPVTVGADAVTGRIVSKADVFLRDRARVEGALSTGGVLKKQTTYTLTGALLEHQSVPTRVLSRKASFSTRAAGISLEPGVIRSTPVAPGNYATLTLKTGSAATLLAGEYFFEEIHIEPNATLTIDNGAGTTYLFANSVNVKGKVTGKDGAYPSLLLSYLGVNEAFVSSPFRGSIVAPNGNIHLGTLTNDSHQGTFIGKRVQVDPNTAVVQRPLPWADVVVTVSKPQVCAGESYKISVQARDAADPSKTPTILIDGAPSAEAWDQAVRGVGKRLIPVSVRMSDGTVVSRIASVQVVACPTATSPNPILYGEADIYQPDQVDFTLGNPEVFEDGTTTYSWSFGDGTTATTSAGATSHKYDWSADPSQRSRAVDVKVTVRRSGVPDVSATRTFIVYNTYALSKARGAIEPPTTVTSPVLARQGDNWTGEFTVKNLEASGLTLNSMRVDQVACDANANTVYGSTQTMSLVVPVKGQLTQSFSIPVSTVGANKCALNVHYWGSTASGTRAQVSVQFDLPAVGAGVPVPEFANRILNHVVENGLVSNPNLVTEEELHRLYRDRKIRYSATNDVFYQAAGPAPGDQCDPDNPGTAPSSGYSCQPTGKWESDASGGPSGAHIANAMKGDSVVVRSCSGFVKTLMAKVDPPQVWTHSGIMTSNRFEITQSTGDEGWLEEHPNGIVGQPTDGFQEHALRYLWPGTLTSTVEEGFATGRQVQTPEGPKRWVKGFNPSEARCSGDRNIVFPRVVKPAPELDALVRARLQAAADAAKGIRGHYRFGSYSVAQDTAANDPNGPSPVDGGDGRSQTFGAVPTVCSQLIRFGLKANGNIVDADKALPTPSDVTNGPADGLFFYDSDERKAAADALYAALYNKVVMELETLEATTDDYWWAGASAAVVGGLIFGPPGAALGVVEIIGGETSGTTIKWATDAPDDVANQVTNCFASDFCSEDAKDSERWQDPGSGFAVSPDDIVNYYDAPNADGSGGLYGYHERMVYRGKRFRPIFEWQPSPGTRTVTGTVLEADGTAAALASVELQGTDKVATTDAAGRFSIAAVPSGNLFVHAQKWTGPENTGELREGNSCYVPDSGNADLLLNVSCDDFTTPIGSGGLSEVLVKLAGPDPAFRKVLINGTVRINDCDCCGFATCPDVGHDTFLLTCLVSPLEPTAGFSIGADQICEDEVGVSVSGTCTLQPDNSVLVSGTSKLFEAGSNSCGGGEEETSENFSQLVPPNATVNIFQNDLFNEAVCISPFPPAPFDCDDSAQFDTFTAQNKVAE
jgi:hypothetical protein